MKRRSPKTESKLKVQYCFRTGEELPDAIGRILAEQLTRAVQVLSRPGDSLEGAVHEARRCLKRARSVLRLVKFAIPNTYRRENGRLRDVGRSLSELRDSHALIQTLDDLEGHRKTRRANAFRDAHTFLESRAEEIAKAMDAGGMQNSIAQLKTALTHIEKLSFAKVNAPGIANSLYRSVKRGRKAFAAAQADTDPEKFHDLRKRAKDLRYQVSLFAELRPDLEQYSSRAKDLEQILGDDHNLAVLTDILGGIQDPGGELHLIREKISGRQSALREKATKIGDRLYRRKKVWKDRLAAIAAEP
jgi:CHAD domain-containing protein